ncbi:MAG: HlyC/CorC family transporter [Planctomycetes bacterium]|nr:HlyC/CorC family transporter [Planctomycetota bacterium]
MDPRLTAILSGVAFLLVSAGAITYVSILDDALHGYNLSHLFERIPEGNKTLRERFAILTRRDQEFILVCSLGRVLFFVLHLCGWVLVIGQDLTEFGLVHLGYAAALSVGTMLVFAMVVPALILRGRFESALLSLLPTFALVALPFKPLTLFRRTVREVGAKMEGDDGGATAASTFKEELADRLEEGAREGVLDSAERKMIHSIVELSTTPASKAMIPRMEMSCADIAEGLDAALKIAADYGHSRVPVFEGTRDRIAGILHTRDVLARWAELKAGGAADLRAMLRPAKFFPASKPLNELLDEMRRERLSIAILMDEHGGTAGLITLEDILERIVGDIRDEFDREEAKKQSLKIKPFTAGVAEADGDVDLEELNRVLDLSLPEGTDYNSLGGYIQNQMGRIPAVGESVTSESLRLTVVDADARRIKRVKLSREQANA